MKKIFSILTLALLFAVVPASAQLDKGFNFGVKAGLNFTNMSNPSDAFKEGFMKTYTGFNAGMVFNFRLPLGFEISPELLYVQSGFKAEGEVLGLPLTTRYNSGSLRVPVNLQWGISILNVVKPYVVVSPYVGAVLFGNGSILGADLNQETVNEYLNRFQYGIGVGAGIYVWRFQVSFKWNWDLNPIFKEGGNFSEAMDSMKGTSKFNGGELSLAFFF